MMPTVVVVQRQVSQLDEPVYSEVGRLTGGQLKVIYWNDYGFVRTHIDPEMGLVPDLRVSLPLDYPKMWIDSRSVGAWLVLRSIIIELRPRLVVFCDIPTKARAALSVALRFRGIGTAFAIRQECSV